MTIAIIDLGCGNLGSVSMALRRLGADPAITSDAAAITSADRLVLPGVGAAGFAMQQIDALGLRSTLLGLRQPVLGICLGMQLLFEASEEDSATCLGILKGHVRALQAAPGRPVPHMGWSRVRSTSKDLGIADGDYAYFAHSYAVDAAPSTVATATYGSEITAVVRQDNWLGAQFHPERSGTAGARFLETFLA